MKYIGGFFAFWYDFIIGDAWEVAVGVVVGLILLYAALQIFGAAAMVPAAILLPLGVMALLGWSVWRVRGSG